MCGIAGLILSTPNSIIPPEWLNTIAKILRHRGPDDVGFLGYRANQPSQLTRDYRSLNDISVGFVHTRLSIIDIAHGWQPMQDPTERYSIIFNGEIYNFVEIKRTLEGYGYSFRTESDTEVLLAAYCHWGKDCIHQLNGMFAFAILDTLKKTIFLARDPFGIKPLYYTRQASFFAFASEMKALLSLPFINRNLNLDTAYEYLITGITDVNSDTFFQEILQLPAAHYVELNLNNIENFKAINYWAPVRARQTVTFSDASETVKEILLHSIKLHLRSDVAIGATLSGGIDSATIVMAMRNIDQHQRIFTFSYLASNKEYNEEKWVDMVQEKATTEAFKVYISPQQLIEEVDDLIYSQDEPFGSTSILAQRLVFKQANQAGIKVTLDGQGADEIFAGYPMYLSFRLLSLLKNQQYLKSGIFLKKLRKNNSVSSLDVFLRMMKIILPYNLTKALERIYLIQNKKLVKQYYDNYKCNTSNQAIYKSREPLFDCLKNTMFNIILPALLRYIDRNSMRFSVESRVPFLSRELVDYIFTLPEEYLISDQGSTKLILRESMRELLPTQILNRKDKISFQTPEAGWLKILTPWAQDLLHRPKIKELNFLNQIGLINEIKGNSSNIIYHSKPRILWRYLNFIRWAEIYNVVH